MKQILLYSGKDKVDSNFLYMTNIDINNIVIKIDFDRKRNKKIIYYDKENVDISKIDKFEKKLIGELERDVKTDIIYTINSIEELEKRYNILVNKKKVSIDRVINKTREIKTENEIKIIKENCIIMEKLFRSLYENIKKFNTEIDILNYINKWMTDNKIDDHSFTPIISNGIDNNIIHNTSYKNSIKNGNLLILDVGIKHNNYCTDVTRMIPIYKYNKKQKQLMEMIKKCLKYGIQLVGKYNRWENVMKKFNKYYCNQLYRLGLIDNVDLEEEEYKKIRNYFMPHELGHHIGLNVHEPTQIDKLEKNMIITIEPGIYFYRNNLEKNNKINMDKYNRYIEIGGIRLEDMILIDENIINLTENIIYF